MPRLSVQLKKKTAYSKFPVTLNVKPPIVTWHIANKCRIPVTCNVTPLHPHVICHPCIPLSSVTPASHPPVICHIINARQIPVTCHVTPSALPYPLSFMLPTHFKFLSFFMLHLLHHLLSSVVTPHKHVNSCHLLCCFPCILTINTRLNPYTCYVKPSVSPVTCHTTNTRQIPVTYYVTPPSSPCHLSYS
jgi:hypothetical protein